MCTIIYLEVCVCVFVGSSKNPQRCLRRVGPHKGLRKTDAVAENAEETERAGAPSAGLLSGTHSNRHTHTHTHTHTHRQTRWTPPFTDVKLVPQHLPEGSGAAD